MVGTNRAGRVTAGLPGLTPRIRNERDIVENTRDLSSRAMLQQRENDAFTVASDGGIDTTNIMAQMGRPLASTEVISRLRRMNANLVFEISMSDSSKYGIYAMELRADPVTGLFGNRKRFICGMESGYQPEFSVRHYREKEVPDATAIGHWRKEKIFTRETRGWRTVLMRLLKERLISEAQIQRYFDSPSRPSRNWQALIN